MHVRSIAIAGFVLFSCGTTDPRNIYDRQVKRFARAALAGDSVALIQVASGARDSVDLVYHVNGCADPLIVTMIGPMPTSRVARVRSDCR